MHARHPWIYTLAALICLATPGNWLLASDVDIRELFEFQQKTSSSFHLEAAMIYQAEPADQHLETGLSVWAQSRKMHDPDFDLSAVPEDTLERLFGQLTETGLVPQVRSVSLRFGSPTTYRIESIIPARHLTQEGDVSLETVRVQLIGDGSHLWDIDESNRSVRGHSPMPESPFDNPRALDSLHPALPFLGRDFVAGLIHALGEMQEGFREEGLEILGFRRHDSEARQGPNQYGWLVISPEHDDPLEFIYFHESRNSGKLYMHRWQYLDWTEHWDGVRRPQAIRNTSFEVEPDQGAREILSKRASLLGPYREEEFELLQFSRLEESLEGEFEPPEDHLVSIYEDGELVYFGQPMSDRILEEAAEREAQRIRALEEIGSEARRHWSGPRRYLLGGGAALFLGGGLLFFFRRLKG